MQTNQLDNELAAYIRGRRDETKDVYKVLEIVRRLGHIDTETASIIIDHLSRIDRRANQLPEEDYE
jgi:hypothetical protein